MDKHCKALELEKILELLASHTTCDDARQAALELEPKKSLSAVQTLLDQTADAHMLMAKFGAPNFGALRNVNNAVRRAEAGGVLNMSELLYIAEDLRVIRSLSVWHSDSAIKTHIDGFFEALIPNKFLEDKITSAIISEEEISDNASPELYDIRRKIRAASARVREKLDKMTHSQTVSKYLREPIVTMRNGRFVVPVKVKNRNEISGLVHDTSSSGATVFVEPTAVVEANNEIKVLQGREKDEIDRILAELSSLAGSFASSIKSSYENAVYLNLVFAKAKLAYDMKAAVPQLNDSGIINLRRARHPLIAKEKVVATDIRLGEEFDTLVITGPNTGGKTVCVKTIGLLTLMTMCGLMIPVADRSVVSVFDRVLVDIGDEQSIEQSLSTFSAHMTNIIGIINAADEKSLVLIDELGAGTDPVEGAALATAILERLHLQGAKVAATTHYAELKAYALSTPRIENGCCEFDVSTLRPTYRLLIGVPGRSNAFAISKRLGMDPQIIDRAKDLVSSENTRFEDVVENLEKSRQEFETKKEEAESLMAQAEADREKAREYKESIDELREKEIEKARSEALRIVEKAKRASHALLFELDEFKKEKSKTNDANELSRRARQQIKKSLGELDEITNPVISRLDDSEEYVLPKELRIGDRVIIKDIGNEAEVVALEDKNGMITVQAGLLRTRVKKENLRLVSGRKKPQQPKTRTVRPPHDESRLSGAAKTECDIRGMNVEEGIMEVDRFIDHSLRMGIGEISVIHGKGTGVLRKGIHDYLRHNPAVKSFRLGTFGEGESGVTIITLK
ncbi:MAG: endonuclease MutS2 [Oscillospiraceae bacterium]|nr:endonuclease MutS2 [Oscillospiraceae bacterium]